MSKVGHVQVICTIERVTLRNFSRKVGQVHCIDCRKSVHDDNKKTPIWAKRSASRRFAPWRESQWEIFEGSSGSFFACMGEICCPTITKTHIWSRWGTSRLFVPWRESQLEIFERNSDNFFACIDGICYTTITKTHI